MYTSDVNKLFQAVSTFRAEAERIEKAIEHDRGEPLDHFPEFERAVQALMAGVREFESALSGAADLVRDTQQIFRRLLSGFFCRSQYLDHAFKKPRGYAGDYQMLEMLYQAELAPSGMERVIDRFVLNMPIARAVIDRKNAAKHWLAEKLREDPTARVIDLACGSSRMERELIEGGLLHGPTLVMVDHDAEALAWSKKMLKPNGVGVQFVRANALELARGRGEEFLSGAKYLVSLGLFEYLPHQISVKLLKTFRERLQPGGEMLICNFDEDSPDRAFMEWVADWPLIYRNGHDFFGLFIEAGFDKSQVTIGRERESGLVLQLAARI